MSLNCWQYRGLSHLAHRCLNVCGGCGAGHTKRPWRRRGQQGTEGPAEEGCKACAGSLSKGGRCRWNCCELWSPVNVHRKQHLVLPKEWFLSCSLVFRCAVRGCRTELAQAGPAVPPSRAGSQRGRQGDSCAPCLCSSVEPVHPAPFSAGHLAGRKPAVLKLLCLSTWQGMLGGAGVCNPFLQPSYRTVASLQAAAWAQMTSLASVCGRGEAAGTLRPKLVAWCWRPCRPLPRRMQQGCGSWGCRRTGHHASRTTAFWTSSSCSLPRPARVP